jgi:hypothetical protein
MTNVLEALSGAPGTLALPSYQRLDHLVKLIGVWVRLGAHWLQVVWRDAGFEHISCDTYCSLGVTSAVVSRCGHDSGQIEQLVAHELAGP